MKKILSLVVFGCLLSNIYGCSPTNILASGGATTMAIADGERSFGTVVDDATIRSQLAELYVAAATDYLRLSAEQAEKEGNKQNQRVFSSAQYLADHLSEVPVIVIPCLEGRPPENTPASMYSGLFGSIYPAIWSFQLALRSRGLGSALTTLHLAFEEKASKILQLPPNVMQVSLLPVAYTIGTSFKRAKRPPAATINHWNSW